MIGNPGAAGNGGPDSGKGFELEPAQQDIDEPSIEPVTISVTNISKHFGPTRALDGCSFSARAGEIHAIVGGNGSGKSTLAKVVSGVLSVDSGAFSIFGETPSTPAESRSLGIATVYQEILVADESTVADNLFMGTDALFSATVSHDDKVSRAAAMMHELVGRPVDPYDVVGALPLATKQWITIGRALLSNPRVLILDESSAALDRDSTERLFAKMRELRDAGSTVLIVTHRIAELVQTSDRATVLRDGRDVGVLDKQQITEKNLLALMTGEDEGADETERHAPFPAGRDTVLRAANITVWPQSAPFDFELLRGEIVGVAGLDGQGQNDFVRILAGVQAAHDGLPHVRDRNGGFTQVRTPLEATRGRIAYVSGDRKREGIFADLSIYENLAMPLYRQKQRGGRLGIIDWAALEAVFARQVENLSIKYGERGDKITSLSGGNQQKVLIGRGFAMRPEIIVLNDPARGIDVGAKAELYDHLRAFAEGGHSVVYMSSEIEEFPGFATRVIVFRNGSPFDAFFGAGVEPHRILEAMFGQSSGSGLAALRGIVAGNVGPAAAAGPDHGPIRIVETPMRRIHGDRSDEIRRRIKVVEYGDRGEVVSRSGA